MITTIAGILLGMVYAVTKDSIDIQEEKERRSAYEAVCGGADILSDNALAENIREVNDENKTELADIVIHDAVKAIKNGKLTGYAVTCSAKGYGGRIEITLGVDLEGKITGIHITDCDSETPGLGQNIADEDWLIQFVGMDNERKDIEAVKNGSGSLADGKVNAVSGATVSSRAVIRAVNDSLKFIQSIAVKYP